MRQVTVYDVADKAGVSISTVSRVLNTPEKVNEKTRCRVLSVIDALGFVPKAEAVDRARRSKGRIGVLAPFFSYSSFTQRLGGVAAALADSPFDLVIYNVDSTRRRDEYLASLPVAGRLDGLIIMALALDEAPALRLIANGLPTVLLEVDVAQFSSIQIDDLAGGRLAAEYLVERGHRHCAFVGDAGLPEYALHKSDLRLAGFRGALYAHGLALPESCVALAPQSLENARLQAMVLLDRPDPPTAIFAASDTQAIGVLRGARELGVRVPEQVAVVGFDDLDIAEYIGLTTVRQPLVESGRFAVELLLGHISDPTRPVQRVGLPLTLIKRETA